MKRNLILVFICISGFSWSQAGLITQAVQAIGLSPGDAAMVKVAQNTETANWLSRLRDSERLRRWHEELSIVRDGLRTAKNTKEEIESIYRLQDQLKKSLKDIRTIEKFSLNDFNYWSKYFLDIDLNPISYIPEIPQTRELRNDINLAMGSEINSRQLYRSINRINRIYDDASTWLSERESKSKMTLMIDNKLMGYSMETAYSELKTEQFIFMNKKMEKNIEDAMKLRQTALDSTVYIEPAVRLELNIKANELMNEAIELRAESMDLLVKINNMTFEPDKKAFFESMVKNSFNADMSKVVFRKSRIMNGYRDPE